MSNDDIDALLIFAISALRAMPCRCQMVGGPKWHCMARTEIKTQCSRCAVIARYEQLTAYSDGKE